MAVKDQLWKKYDIFNYTAKAWDALDVRSNRDVCFPVLLSRDQTSATSGHDAIFQTFNQK